MSIVAIEFEISGFEVTTFDWRSEGFGVPCDRCGSENAQHQLSGDMPPGIPGTYCDTCHDVVCAEASDYYKNQVKIQTKDLKTTVLFRKGGKWSVDEVNRLINAFETGVWWNKSEYPEYLIVEGHYPDEAIPKALGEVPEYTVTDVIGIESEALPFIPV